MRAEENGTADVCVIGAGPAGCVFAARMAQLGYEVCLVERDAFPRSHLGESLSPGVLPLLETIGAREAVESAGFRHVRNVQMKWDREPEERHDPRELGLLVDRGRFDSLLLERARTLGVRVFQPATVRERRRHDEGWQLRVTAEGRAFDLEAAFLADASGRAAVLPGARRRTARRTFALYAYWRGQNLPEQPRIEASRDAWYWGVPLPDGTYNTLVFVDSDRLRGASAASIQALFRELIDGSELMTGCSDARLIGPVRAVEATPYLDEHSVTSSSIKVGDAALAIDPLSSSGVQKAIQTALAGAVVANTLRREPELSAAAIQFYREHLAQASKRHCLWAGEHYAAVATSRGGKFWEDRAGLRATNGETFFEPTPARLPGGESARGNSSEAPLLGGAGGGLMASQPIRKNQEHSQISVTERTFLKAALEISPLLEFMDAPCLEGEFVAVKPTLRHPRLDAPIAYLGGWELAPLLRQVRPGMTALEVARAWSARVPMKAGLAIASWLLGHGLLVPQAASTTRRPAYSK